MNTKMLSNRMVSPRVVTEIVDDAKLVEEIEELKEQIEIKTKELKKIRKDAVLKYCTELENGEFLYNTYCNSCYVYIGNDNDLYEFNET